MYYKGSYVSSVELSHEEFFMYSLILTNVVVITLAKLWKYKDLLLRAEKQIK